MDIKKYYISFCAYNICVFNNLADDGDIEQAPVPIFQDGKFLKPILPEEKEVEKDNMTPAPLTPVNDDNKKGENKMCNCGSVQIPSKTPEPIKNEKKIKNDEITNVPDRMGTIGHDIRKTNEFIGNLQSSEDKRKFFEKFNWQLYQYNELTKECMEEFSNDCKKLYDEVLTLNEQFKEKINHFFLKKILKTKYDTFIENFKNNSYALKQIKKELEYSYENCLFKNLGKQITVASPPKYYITKYIYDYVISNPLITLLWLTKVFDGKNFLKNQGDNSIINNDENKQFDSIFIAFLDYCSKNNEFFNKIKEVLSNTDEYSNIHYLLMIAISGFNNVMYKYKTFEYKNIIKEIFKTLNTKKPQEVKNKFNDRLGIVFDSNDFKGELPKDLNNYKNEVKGISKSIINGEMD